MLQKYSAESAGQPALEITPSAGFPPREVRVETGSHTSGPHTLLFWDKGSPPGAACRGRGGTVPSSSCWRAVRPRSRTALPPPPPLLPGHLLRHTQAPGTVSSLGEQPDPGPQSPGDLFCCFHAATPCGPVSSRGTMGTDWWQVCAVRTQGDNADKVSAPRTTLTGPWSRTSSESPAGLA